MAWPARALDRVNLTSINLTNTDLSGSDALIVYRTILSTAIYSDIGAAPDIRRID